MKTKILITFFMATLLLSATANAARHRVNYLSNYNASNGTYGENFGGNSVHPVFNQLTTAVGSPYVGVGDTIYLEGNPTGTQYNGLNLTKKLTIIGTGYFLSLNPKTSNDLLSSNLNNINFNAGSEGSQLIGVSIVSYLGIDINVGQITIKRCYIPEDAEINLANGITDVNILQNFFDNTNLTNTCITSSYLGAASNVRINNNIFKRTLHISSNNAATGGTTYQLLECKNNTFDCPPITGAPSIRMNSPAFQNNIVKPTTVTLSINSGVASGNVTYNTGSANGQFDYDLAYNNKLVSNMATLFVTSGTSTDGNYKLQSASAGNHPGSDGSERGAFGNVIPAFRYTLSGLPPVPVIYDLYTPGTAVNGNLEVTIKARTIK